MRKFYILGMLMVLAVGAMGQNRFWVAGAAANWSSDNWASSSGGAADGLGPPADAETARFDANGVGNCTLDLASDSMSGLQMNGYTGILDINGNTLITSGTVTLTTGTINDGLGTGSFRLTSSNTVTFNGTTIGANITATCASLVFSGSTFNGNGTYTKTGSGGNTGTGGNVWNGTADFIHEGSGGNWIFGNTNPDDWNADVTFTNTGSGTFFICQTAAGSTIDGNVQVTSTGSGGGILFGNNGGTTTLGSGFTITVGGSGFSNGTLRLRGFTQSGTTAQNITLTNTGTAFDIYDATFGGNVVFEAPRLTTRGTTYSGTAQLTKNDAANDNSNGGNIFVGDANLICSGSGQMLMGNNVADTFRANLTIVNSGTNTFYLGNNVAGNYVGGNLDLTHSTGGNNTSLIISNGSNCSVVVDGNVTVSNTSSGTGNGFVYLGNNGDMTIGGTVTSTNNGTANNNSVYVANGTTSAVSITGESIFTNAGSNNTSRTYLGNSGSCTFGNTLQVLNTSSATNSQFYLQQNSSSVNTYNGNVILENSNANGDGIYFGNNGGSGTMAAGFSVSINGNGFQGSQQLVLRNFTQQGTEPISLTATGTTRIYFYDSEFGGNVTSTSPRLIVRGSRFNGTATLEKNGASDEQSNGGNVFVGDCQLTCSGSGYFLMGSGGVDSALANLTLVNSGSRHIYWAHNTAGNYIGGNLTVTNSGSGNSNYSYISNNAGATLTIVGDVTMTNSSSSTDGRILFGNTGSITCQGKVSGDNNGSATTCQLQIATNDGSVVTIADSATFTNSGTGTSSRLYLGNSGDMTFSGPLTIASSSGATNSQVYLQHNTSSQNTYAQHITIENSNASGDGFYFGNNGGSGTIASGATISISGGGFAGGQLFLRNLTQNGSEALNLVATGTTLITSYDCSWGGNVVLTAPQLITRGSSYAGTATLEKNGATNNTSVGGNTFTGNASITNSGSGTMTLASTDPDSASANLSLICSGSSSLSFTTSAVGSYVGGNLTTELSGTSSTFTMSSNTGASITVDGNVTATNTSSAATTNFYLSNNGDFTVGNVTTINHSPTGAAGTFYVSNGTTSTTIFGDSVTATNSGGTNTRRFYFGNSGDITFNGRLSITNSSGATNSQVYLHNNSSSVNAYNGDIVLEVTNASSDGIYFGNSTGSGTLAATRTISIGGGGYIAGFLYLRNFTQVGATDQTLEPTSTTNTTIYDCSFGGNVTLSSPRITTRGTTYSGTLSFSKTGASDDQSVGGNNVGGDCVINNTSSGYILMANGSPDVFGGKVTINNTGTRHVYLAYNSTGNTIADSLICNNGGSTSDNDIRVCSQIGSNLTVTGPTVVRNTSTSPSSYVYLGDAGDITFNNSVTVTNSGTGTTRAQVIIADDSSSQVAINGALSVTNNAASGNSNITYVGINGDVAISGDFTAVNSSLATTGIVSIANNLYSSSSVGGNTVVTNSGTGATTTRIFLGSVGDVTFDGTVTITNSSNSTNNEVFCNNSSSSVNVYNNDIILEATNASSDGISFGEGGGSATLAATRTISIGGGGFVSGDLYLRNFTQIGATDQTLEPTGTTVMTVYDCNWGGNITFSAPRISSRGTVYSGTLDFTKTDANNDNSNGGNSVAGNCTLNNSGSGRLLWGNGTADTFSQNLTLNNSGTSFLYVAYNAAGNSVGGTLTVNQSATGSDSRIYIADQTASTLTVTGATTVTNTGSATTNLFYLGNQGDITFNSGITVNHNPTGGAASFYIGNGSNSTIGITGDVTINNGGGGGTSSQTFVGNEGDVTISGRLDITSTNTGTAVNDYVASNANSTVSIGGTTTVSINGSATTGRAYLGNSGDVTFGDSLIISNGASATNSQIYLNHNSTSVNAYNGNIVLEVTDANCDGIYFGNSTGSGTLAATRTISIGSNGFIAGALYIRNFTQVGATAQTLEPTGTTTTTIYDCDWGGDVTLSSPQITSRGTLYQGTLSFTKTGSSSNYSAGGNYITGNCILANTGSGALYFGNGGVDTFAIDLTINNSGTSSIYAAQSTSGHFIGGNLVISQTSSGSDSRTYLAENSTSNLVVTGTANITNTSSASTSQVYLGNNGDISFGSSVTVTHNSTGSGTATFYIASGSGSVVSIAGTLTVTNSGSVGTTCQSYIGNNGQVTIGGDLNLTNSATTTNGYVYVATGAASSVAITGNTVLNHSGSGSITRSYLGNSGDVTFTGTLSVTNSSGSNNSQVYLNNASSSANVYNNDIVLEVTDASSDGILFGNGGGTGTLADGRTITIGGGGFIAGSLYLRNFTQTGGTAQALHPTGTTTLTLYDASWGGNVNFSSPRIQTRGTTYSGTATLEKTGGTDDSSAGGNTFVGNVTLNNSGSGYFLMGNGTFDDFQMNVVMSLTGSDHMYLGYSGAGHTVGGTLTATNSGSSGTTLIYFGSTSTSTLAVTGDVTLTNNASSTSAGFVVGDQGDLTLGGNLTLTSNPTASTINNYIGNNALSSVAITGDLVATNGGSGSTHRLYIPSNGDVTVGGTLHLTNSTAATTGQLLITNGSSSSLIVGDTMTVINSGTGSSCQTYVSNTGDLTTNGPLLITNSSGSNNSQVYCNNSSASLNTYNHNIVLECTDSNSDGIYFANGNGSATLAANRTISIGGGGFTGQNLYIRNFTQTGATAQTIATGGSCNMTIYDCNWGGDVTFSSSRITTRGTNYSGTVSLEKTGASNDFSAGGNTFDGPVTFTLSGTGNFGHGNGTADDYNGDVSYVKTGSGLMYPTYNSTSTYAGNISFNTNTQVTLGSAGNGVVEMDGNGAQSINDLGSTAEPIFRRLTLNNVSNDVTLNTPITIQTTMTFTQGNLNTSSANLLTIRDNATVSGASVDSYVNGPMDKIGNDAFTFPVGDSARYRPITMSAPSNGAAQFRATYFETDPDPLYDRSSLDAGISRVSVSEYWTLDRINTTNNVTVTLSWDSLSGVNSLTDLLVARWDTSVNMWINHGNGGTTGDTTAGTIVSSSSITNFSPFALASSVNSVNPLPIELVDFDAVPVEEAVEIDWTTATEINNDFFTVERSANGEDFEPIATVDGAGNSNVMLDYATTDDQPLDGLSYYRLKQTDFNGDYSYSRIVAVEFKGQELAWTMFPNPSNGERLTLRLEATPVDQLVQVVDLSGRIRHAQVLSPQSPQLLDLQFSHRLEAGVYIVSLSGSDGSAQTKRLVIQ